MGPLPAFKYCDCTWDWFYLFDHSPIRLSAFDTDSIFLFAPLLPLILHLFFTLHFFPILGWVAILGATAGPRPTETHMINTDKKKAMQKHARCIYTGVTI